MFTYWVVLMILVIDLDKVGEVVSEAAADVLDDRGQYSGFIAGP